MGRKIDTIKIICYVFKNEKRNFSKRSILKRSYYPSLKCLLKIKNHLYSISLLLILTVTSLNSASAQIQIKDSSNLASISFTKKVKITREIYLSFLTKRIIIAEKEDRLNDANALLVTPGKILASKDAVKDNLSLLRTVIHEEIEALMQILWNNRHKNHTYSNITELILNNIHNKGINNKTIFELYNILLPQSKQYKTIPQDESKRHLFLNDLVSKAFELLILTEKKMIENNEMLLEEKEFVEALRPIIMTNRHNLFNQAFWDPTKRKNEIKRAINQGIHFDQAAMMGMGMGMGMGMRLYQSIELRQNLTQEQKLEQELELIQEIKLELGIKHELKLEIKIKHELKQIQKMQLEPEQQITLLKQKLYFRREKSLQELWADASSNNKIIQYNKHGFNFLYASIKIADLQKYNLTWVLDDCGYAFSVCLTNPFDKINGIKYDLSKGQWLLFVIEDVHPDFSKPFQEYAAIHERAEQLTLGNHPLATKVEFAIAKEERKLTKYLQWIMKTQPKKMADNITLIFPDSTEFYNLVKEGIPLEESETAQSLAENFKWPIKIKEIFDKYQDANTELENKIDELFQEATKKIGEISNIGIKQTIDKMEQIILQGLSEYKLKKIKKYLLYPRLNKFWTKKIMELDEIFSKKLSDYQKESNPDEYALEIKNSGYNKTLASRGLLKKNFETVAKRLLSGINSEYRDSEEYLQSA